MYTGANLYAYTTAPSDPDNALHRPGPYSDYELVRDRDRLSRFMSRPGSRFGFLDGVQLKAWLEDSCRAGLAARENMRLLVYRVEEEDLLIGATQVIFDVTKAAVVQILNLMDV